MKELLSMVGMAIGVVAFGMCFHSAGCSDGARSALKKFRDEAVKKGKAEYYLDENNERQWRWKE